MSVKGGFLRAAALAALALALCGCASDGGGNGLGPGWQAVQVVDIERPDPRAVGGAPAATAVIQPEDLTLSPVIDIEALKALDGPTARAASSTLAQAERKAEIAARFDAGETGVDASLDESAYNGGDTSGALAEAAAADAFDYIKGREGYCQAIAEYDFVDGRIYELVASPKGITDFRLRPGETLSGSPIVQNPADWQFSSGSSLEDGQPVQHLFIRPLKAGLDTSMILLTNERTYNLRAASFENSHMRVLRFRYPTRVAGGYMAEGLSPDAAAAAAAPGADYRFDVTKADYGYRLKAKGRPAWRPVTVFSDERKTYIQFPVDIKSSSSLPSVYLLRGREEGLVNYRIFGNLYQIDAVLSAPGERFLLKSGQSERVEISRAER